MGIALALGPDMVVQRTAPQASVADVLDRVLDRGIVIDAWLRVSVAGIALIDIDARVVVASLSTYLRHADAVAEAAAAAGPVLWEPPPATSPRSARRLGRVRLGCRQGCTFVRPARRPPATVRCPSQPGRRCPVQAIPPAA
jgi:hypothetical protein